MSQQTSSNVRLDACIEQVAEPVCLEGGEHLSQLISKVPLPLALSLSPTPVHPTPSSQPIKASKPKLDLREPALTSIRKGWGKWLLGLMALLLVDSTLLCFAWWIAETYTTPLDFTFNPHNNPLAMLPTLVIQIGLLAIQGFYGVGEQRRNYLGVVKALMFAHGLLLLVAFFSQPSLFIPRSTFIWSLLLSVGFTCAGRFGLNVTLEALCLKGWFAEPTFIICDKLYQEKIAGLLKKEERYHLVGMAEASSLDLNRRTETIAKINCLGATEVFVDWRAINNRMFIFWLFEKSGINLHILYPELKQIYRQTGVSMLGGIHSIDFYSPIITGSQFFVKRMSDFCLTVLILLVTLPVLLVIALLIKLDSPGSIFYKQTRIGLKGQEFKMWKFRTMVPNAEQLQNNLEASNQTKDGILFKIKDDPRITRVGKFLRRYSLDELPQLFNVLLGDMSLVGPRPLPVRDVNKFSSLHHTIRHEVLPGITGLWQVSGRSNILEFDEVVRLDMFYIENWSLRLDLQILLQTVGAVLRKAGAY